MPDIEEKHDEMIEALSEAAAMLLKAASVAKRIKEKSLSRRSVQLFLIKGGVPAGEVTEIPDGAIVEGEDEGDEG
jgi:hypothetical protein